MAVGVKKYRVVRKNPSSDCFLRQKQFPEDIKKELSLFVDKNFVC